MKTKPNGTVIRAWARLNKAQHQTMLVIERALKNAGMPPLAWYDVLLELARTEQKSLRPFELEKELLFSQYNLSRLLQRIEKSGYIERCPCDADGRGQNIQITNAGIAIREQMWPIYSAAIEEALGVYLADGETRQLDSLLGKLIQHDKK